MIQLFSTDWLPLTALGSILIVAGLTGLLRLAIVAKKRSQMTRQLLCPICVGVVATWGWLLAARFLGVAVPALLLGVFLAGSAVGLVSQLEKYWWLRRGYLVWKVFAVAAGLAGAYLLASENWWGVMFAMLAWLTVTAIFLLASGRQARLATNRTSQAAQLQEQMKNCC